MHRYHPDPDRNDDPQALLYDDCPDCDSAAANPVFRLDADRLQLLFQMLVDIELEAGHYRSMNDRRAVMALWPTYILAERNPRLYAAIAETAAARSAVEECIQCGGTPDEFLLLNNGGRVCGSCAAEAVSV